IQQRAGIDAALLRDDLRDHRGAAHPLAADAERGDDAEEDERPHVRCERAGRRAERVHPHRQQQRARAAQSIRNAPEDDSAGGPADEQQRGEDAGPPQRRSGGLGRAERDAEQHRHARRRDVVEEQAVEDVEAPPEPGREQDHPLIAVHVEHRAAYRLDGDAADGAPLGCARGRHAHRVRVRVLDRSNSWPPARIVYAKATGDPSFAGLPSMVMRSPTLSAPRLRPAWRRTPGAASSISQCCTAPFAPFASMSTYGCGFTDSTRVTAPVTVTRLVTSNIICAAWCAHAGTAAAASAAPTNTLLVLRFICPWRSRHDTIKFC